MEFRTEYGKKSVHMVGLFLDSFNGINLDSTALNDLILAELGLSKTAIKAKGTEVDSSYDDGKAYREGVLRCQVDFKTAANLIQKYGGLVTVHAGSKSNSFDDEMRHEESGVKNVNLADSLGPVKEELLKNYIDICEVRNSKKLIFAFNNKDYESFTELSLEPNHWGGFGSMVPCMQERVGVRI